MRLSCRSCGQSRGQFNAALNDRESPRHASPHVENEASLVRHAVGSPGGVPYQIDIDDTDAGNAGDRILHHLRQLSRRRAVGRGQRHDDIDGTVVLEIDLVDQTELVNIGGYFGVEHGFQRRDDFAAQPLGFLRRQGRVRFHVANPGLRTASFRGFGFYGVTHANSSPALISARARWSTSSRVLYIPNEALHVAVTLNRSKSGITQWVPARTAMPWRSITVATSWAWAPFSSKEITGPLPRAVPISRSELISRSFSWA